MYINRINKNITFFQIEKSVNELKPSFFKYSALGLLKDSYKHYEQLSSIHSGKMADVGCYMYIVVHRVYKNPI